MTVLKDIQDEVKAAMRAGRKEDVTAYRMLVSELQRAAKDAGVAELSEEQEFEVLARERKKRLEAAEAFRDGGREELAAKEEREAQVIDRFLPQRLTDDELESLIEEAMDEAQASGLKDMGKVMGIVMSRGGTRIDGKAASARVKERLSA